MKSILFLILVCFITGCEQLPDDGRYSGSRRSTSVFQIADQPVHQHPVEEEEVQIEPIEEVDPFELSDPIVDVQEPKPVMEKVIPFHEQYTEPVKVRNAQPLPSSIDIPETSLPKVAHPNKLSKKDLQYLLKELGYYRGKVDGVIGPVSLTAIRRFQKDHGLKVDGIAGKRTKARLIQKIQEKYGR